MRTWFSRPFVFPRVPSFRARATKVRHLSPNQAVYFKQLVCRCSWVDFGSRCNKWQRNDTFLLLSFVNFTLHCPFILTLTLKELIPKLSLPIRRSFWLWNCQLPPVGVIIRLSGLCVSGQAGRMRVASPCRQNTNWKQRKITACTLSRYLVHLTGKFSCVVSEFTAKCREIRYHTVLAWSRFLCVRVRACVHMHVYVWCLCVVLWVFGCACQSQALVSAM